MFLQVFIFYLAQSYLLMTETIKQNLFFVLLSYISHFKLLGSTENKNTGSGLWEMSKKMSKTMSKNHDQVIWLACRVQTHKFSSPRNFQLFSFFVTKILFLQPVFSA